MMLLVGLMLMNRPWLLLPFFLKFLELIPGNIKITHISFYMMFDTCCVTMLRISVSSGIYYFLMVKILLPFWNTQYKQELPSVVTLLWSSHHFFLLSRCSLVCINHFTSPLSYSFQPLINHHSTPNFHEISFSRFHMNEIIWYSSCT